MLDLISANIAASCLLLALIGACAAVAASWTSDVAADLPEDGLLLRGVVVALRDGVGRRGGRRAAASLAALSCAALPLALDAPFHVFAVLAAVAVPAAVMDARLHVIPEELTWGLMFAGVLMSPWHQGAADAVAAGAIAAAATWFSMAVIEYGTAQPARSGGDIAAAVAGGAWVGTMSAGIYLLSACIVFMAYTALAQKLAGGERWMPMGPALLAAIPIAAAAAPALSSL